MRLRLRRAWIAVALTVAGFLAGAALPVRADAVAIADPAGDTTCTPGCPDLVSVEEVAAGPAMRFTFTSATPWGAGLPELWIWRTAPDTAPPDMALLPFGTMVNIIACGDWTVPTTCVGGEYAKVERPTPTTVVYEVRIGQAHRWQAAVAHPGGFAPDPAPFDRAPDGGPVAGVALPDRDGDGRPDQSDACPDHAGDPSGDGCPLFEPRDVPFFRLFHCASGGVRTFDYVFRPHGGGGAPADLTRARYLHPFEDASADASRPHLGVFARRGGSWRAWADTRAFATPAARPHCSAAGPSPAALYHPAHKVRTKKPAAVRCRFRSRFGYLGVFGIGGASPLRLRRVIAHDFLVRHGHPTSYRTFLTARLSGGAARLVYDRKACKRIPLPR